MVKRVSMYPSLSFLQQIDTGTMLTITNYGFYSDFTVLTCIGLFFGFFAIQFYEFLSNI